LVQRFVNAPLLISERGGDLEQVLAGMKVQNGKVLFWAFLVLRRQVNKEIARVPPMSRRKLRMRPEVAG